MYTSNGKPIKNLEDQILISSNLILDEIWLPSGDKKGIYPGGAALWAATGARLFWKNIHILAGVGEDFEDQYGSLFDTLDLSRESLKIRDKNSIQSTLVYRTEDQRTEKPKFGLAHFSKMQTRLRERPMSRTKIAGTYIFRDLWPEFWDDVEAMQQDLGVIVWELQGDIAKEEYFGAIKRKVPIIDCLSLNLREASGITGKSDPIDCAKFFFDAGAKKVVIRAGEEGAYCFDGVFAFQAMPASSDIVDATGGGNAFTGGLLAGLILHDDFTRAAQCASSAAAIVLAQFGAPERLDEQLAQELASQVEIKPIK